MSIILWLVIGCFVQIVFYGSKILTVWSLIHILLWPVFIITHLIVWGLYSLFVIIPIVLVIVAYYQGRKFLDNRKNKA